MGPSRVLKRSRMKKLPKNSMLLIIFLFFLQNQFWEVNPWKKHLTRENKGIIPPLYWTFFRVDWVFLCVIDERQIDGIDESSTEFLVGVHHQLTSHVIGTYSPQFLTEVIGQNGQLHHLQIIGKYGVGLAGFMTESPALDRDTKHMRETILAPQRWLVSASLTDSLVFCHYKTPSHLSWRLPRSIFQIGVSMTKLRSHHSSGT